MSKEHILCHMCNYDKGILLLQVSNKFDVQRSDNTQRHDTEQYLLHCLSVFTGMKTKVVFRYRSSTRQPLVSAGLLHKQSVVRKYMSIRTMAVFQSIVHCLQPFNVSRDEMVTFERGTL